MKLPLIAFPHSAAEKFRISVDCKTAIRSHCTTDVQPMHSSVRRPFLPYSLWSLQSLPDSKRHISSLVHVTGFSLYNRCDSHRQSHEINMFNLCAAVQQPWHDWQLQSQLQLRPIVTTIASCKHRVRGVTKPQVASVLRLSARMLSCLYTSCRHIGQHALFTAQLSSDNMIWLWVRRMF